MTTLSPAMATSTTAAKIRKPTIYPSKAPFDQPSVLISAVPPSPPAHPTIPVIIPMSLPNLCGTSWNTALYFFYGTVAVLVTLLAVADPPTGRSTAPAKIVKAPKYPAITFTFGSSNTLIPNADISAW